MMKKKENNEKKLFLNKEKLRAKLQSDGALNTVIKRRSEDAQRLKDENADLKGRLEELEEKHIHANRQF